jgi:hypothetical protein
MSRCYKKNPPRNYYRYVEQLIMSLQLQYEIVLASDNLLWSINFFFLFFGNGDCMDGVWKYMLQVRTEIIQWSFLLNVVHIGQVVSEEKLEM